MLHTDLIGSITNIGVGVCFYGIPSVQEKQRPIQHVRNEHTQLP